MEGDCRICKQYDEELTHLNLYVNGSEGIWICLNCRIGLTNTAKAMQSVADRAIHHSINIKAKME